MIRFDFQGKVQLRGKNALDFVIFVQVLNYFSETWTLVFVQGTFSCASNVFYLY